MPSFTINVNGENYTVGYDGTFDSPQGLLPALNNLGFGIFWIEQIGGVNVLTTTDDDDVYGTAETNADPTTTTTTTTSTTTTSTTAAPTTTTTTTAAPTTTTTTTAAPTTTTTTTAAPTTTTTSTTTSTTTLKPCACIEVVITSAGGELSYLECETRTPAVTVYLVAGTYNQCVDKFGGLIQADITSGTGTITQVGNCLTQACPPPTTTTSTTTTTTTLFAQTVSYANDLADACFNPIGNQNVTGNSTSFCTCTSFNSAGFVTLDNGNYVLGYNGDTLNVNIAGAPTTTAIVTGVGCTVCPLTTTTSTTTTTTTIFAQTVSYANNATDACLNPTGTQNVVGNSTAFCTSTIFTSNGFATLPNGNYVLAYLGNTLGINISGFPTITATVTGGGCSVCPLSTSTTTTTTSQPPYVYYVATRCDNIGLQQYFRTTGTFAVGESVSYNGYCWEIQSLTGTSGVDYVSAYINCASCNGSNTTTTTSTTTTSTTLPPVTANISSVCTGLTQTITIDTFGGGSGTYFASTTTYADPVSAAAGAVTSVSGSRDYPSQPNGTRYVYVTSTGGAPVVKQGGQTCTTTTTTTQPPYVYYVATRCDNIGLQQYFRTTGTFAVGESVSYNGYCWEIQSLTGTSGVDYVSAYINCASCNGSNTTTTTSTTTTSTTLPPVTANISSVCTGITQTITVDTFGGGSGTYFASTTTYGDPVSAAAGAVTSVSGSRSYSTQPNGTRYVYVTSTGGAPVVKQGGQTCTTTSTTTTTTTPAPTTTTTSTTTTITTPPPYIYYVATRCDNPSLQQYFRTISSYVAGISVLYQGYCWEIQSQTGTSGVDAESVYISCTSCNGSNPTTTSTTTTTTTAAPSCSCYTIVNEGGTTGNYTYVDCATGQTLSPNINSGETQNRCVLSGNIPTQNTGFLTIIDCTTPCSVEGDCFGC